MQRCRCRVKLRKSHNEQMSSALDPTTDMAPLGKHLHFEKREGSSRGMFPTPVHPPARHVGSSRYATRFGDAPPCAALGWPHSSDLKSFRTARKGRVASDTEHPFCGRDGAPIGRFKVGFNRVLKEVGMGTSVEMLDDLRQEAD